MKVKHIASIIFCLLLQQTLLFSHIRLPAVIGSNMVILRDGNVPIWGWADPGEQVMIRASWMASDIAVIANDKGEWIIGLDSPCAGGPHQITLKGKNEIVLENILAGEVWFASGQSNMAMALEGCENAEMEIASARYPAIRFFHLERTFNEERQTDCRGTCIPSSICGKNEKKSSLRLKRPKLNPQRQRTWLPNLIADLALCTMRWLLRLFLSPSKG